MSKQDIIPLCYWFKGATQVPVEFRPRFGMDDKEWSSWPRTLLNREAGSATWGSRPGPGEGTGLLVSPFSLGFDRDQLRYDPELQEAVEIEDGAWILVSKVATAADFRRSEGIPSSGLVLNAQERGTWELPMGLIDRASCVLPTVDQFCRGQWHVVAASDYREIADICMLFYKVQNGEAQMPDREQTREMICKIFAVNYDLTPAELGAMGMLNTAFYSTIIALITDLPARQQEAQAQKKTTTQ